MADIYQSSRENLSGDLGCYENADAPSVGLLAEPNSYHRLQPLALDEAQQLQRRTARPLVARLPLLNRGQTGVQHRGEYGLAELGALSQRLDFLRGHLRHIEMPQRLELAHATLADQARAVKPMHGLAHLLEDAALTFDCCHDQSRKSLQCPSIPPGAIVGQILEQLSDPATRRTPCHRSPPSCR